MNTMPVKLIGTTTYSRKRRGPLTDDLKREFETEARTVFDALGRKFCNFRIDTANDIASDDVLLRAYMDEYVPA